MRRWIFPLVLMWPGLVAAQTDDRSYLTAFLEDNLSDIGRTVTITGFTGALSSQATLQSMTIADANGVWLTLNGVVLDWNRAALFSGQLSVNALTAEEIIVARAPVSESSGAPSPEASGFSLPELPVSVDIGRIAADKIVLEAPLIGTTVEGTFEASMALAGGEGRANLTLDRTDDGPDGNVTLSASYSNASRQLVWDLDATEAAGGLAAKVLGLPGEPSTSLTIKGSGPVDDFAADIALKTDDVDRLTGRVVLGGTEDGAMQFSTDLSGDLAPLFVPEYAEFFGSNIALKASGARSADGRMRLSDLALQTRVLALKGSIAVAADGMPEKFALTASLESPDGTSVLLPLTTAKETRVARANLDLSFDAAASKDWGVTGVIEGFDRPDLKIARLSLDGSGKIERGTAGTEFNFTTKFGAEGLAPADPALAQALGPAITGAASGLWEEGSGNLAFSTFDLSGNGVSLNASGKVEGISTGLTVTGKAVAEIADLARLSALAGRPLAGGASVRLDGTGSILGGTFDLTAAINGTDLRIGQAEADALLRGPSQIEVSVARTEAGTDLRNLVVTAATLKATAMGKIASTGSDLSANLTFSDLSAMGGQYRGALTATAAVTGTLDRGQIQIVGTGDGLGIGQAEADKLLRGQSTVSAKLDLVDGTVVVGSVNIRNPQVTLDANAPNGAGSQIDLTAKLANLGLLLPEFPGVVTVSGTASNENTGFRIDLKAQGPGQIDASIAGLVGKDGSADLAIKGTGQAALANAFIEPRAVSGGLVFDLQLNGPLQPSSLTGQATLAGGRVSSPDLPFSLLDTAVTANLSGGQAQMTGQTAVSTGGSATISGSFGLAAPNTADLALRMRDVVLRDPQLFETRASGNLTIIGPLNGGAVIAGQIDLRDTELQIPSSGLGGVEAIPDLRHIREPGPVRATRARAGLLGGGADGSGRADVRAYGLDLAISAPNRVFLRGRGLDAELGGTLRLRGTTAAVIPDGGLNLIRGRLDILGKRLVLSEAQLRLEGDFVPFIRIAASTESDGVTSSVLIEGLANDPVVSFTSSPQLPQEEVLSRLLFGRGLETLSAFQAAQLAGAVASLAGKGGDGIVAKLRKGFGLDDLDVRTADDGTASFRAGKYISRNIYSEIEVDQDGKSQIQLNLDVTDSVTLRGRASSDGTTGIGIVVEKDY
jgi:translocation and assembly module TamB